MLKLTRRQGETLVFDNDIRITISRIRGRQARIEIEAPKDVKVMREELLDNPSPPEARDV